MQTPKARPGSLEVPQRKSPATPRAARQLKMPGSDSDSVSSSPHPASRAPKDKSPKVIERRSPRSPAAEKKRPSRVSELESQLAQLQEDLKKAKDQLNSSESWKRRAQQEAEEAKKQLSTMSAKLEESQQQLLELSAADDDRIQELREISQDRDRAWQSELEAVQKQHSIDSAALASTMNEIQKLKAQLEMVAESEATQSKLAESAHDEIQGLRVELAETLSLVEKLKAELTDCRVSEARALELVGKTQMQLETANATAEMLRSDGIKAMEAYNSLSLELEQSKAQIKSLEGLVSKLQVDLANSSSKNVVGPASDVKSECENGEKEETKQLEAELNFVKSETGQLRSALDAAEIRYQEEYIQSTLQIRSAYEQVERIKSESCEREAELEAELKKAKAHIEELRATLMDKETELQTISEENEGLNMKIEKNQSSDRESELTVELKKSEADLAELKTSLLDKETELQSITEENEMLKMEIEKREMEKNKVNDEAVALAEAARVAEREALMKLGYVTEEADKSSRRAAQVAEQLDKETELQSITEEKEMLKMEIEKREMEKNKVNDEAVALAEAARAAEREALMKLGYVTEEADKSSRRAARVAEQLDAAQAANSELEAELRRLKVQSDQWRKAAEAAAAIISTGNNGKYVERTGSLDSSYNPITGRMGSPYLEDMDDDSPKKKNTNMLKKIGVLWKKGHS